MNNYTIIILLINFFCFSQEYPKFDFNPLGIPVSLAGNYAELRPNHFHAGLDYKTQEKEGFSISSVDDGFISRINISWSGYGNALYVTHKNGYTTVYAHCKEFSERIQNIARNHQYKLKSFAIDVNLNPNDLPVKKGEIIAVSGNSGSSSGPHLHFEVRNTKTEEPINPLYFGFNVEDNRNPVIENVYVYLLEGLVNNKNQSFLIKDFNKEIPVSGNISFGIQTYDKQNNSENINGVYKINSYVNDELYFTFLAHKFSFAETRYIHALVDYSKRINSSSWIYQTFIVPGNKLNMYENVKNKGILFVEKDKKYKIDLEVFDFNQNKTSKTFYLIGNEYSQKENKPENQVKYNKDYKYKDDLISLFFESGSFYQDFSLNVSSVGSKVIINRSDFPVHKRFELKYNTKNLDPNKLDKAVIVLESNSGKYKKEYLDTENSEGFLKTNPRDFGIFSVEYDLEKPTITPLFSTKKLPDILKFKIKDNKSGIKSYNVYINDSWVLASYDKKNDLLEINLKKEIEDSKNYDIKIIVIDKVNNQSLFNL